MPDWLRVLLEIARVLAGLGVAASCLCSCIFSFWRYAVYREIATRVRELTGNPKWFSESIFGYGESDYFMVLTDPQFASDPQIQSIRRRIQRAHRWMLAAAISITLFVALSWILGQR